MKGDLFISLPLFTAPDPYNPCIGVVYHTTRPSWGKHMITYDVIDTVGYI